MCKRWINHAERVTVVCVGQRAKYRQSGGVTDTARRQKQCLWDMNLFSDQGKHF